MAIPSKKENVEWYSMRYDIEEESVLEVMDFAETLHSIICQKEVCEFFSFSNNLIFKEETFFFNMAYRFYVFAIENEIDIATIIDLVESIYVCE